MVFERTLGILSDDNAVAVVLELFYQLCNWVTFTEGKKKKINKDAKWKIQSVDVEYSFLLRLHLKYWSAEIRFPDGYWINETHANKFNHPIC